MPTETDPSQPSQGGNISLWVEGYRIQGNSRFSEAELQLLLQPWQKRELTFSELYGVAQQVIDYYRQNGYLLTYVYLPPQEIDNGIVQLNIQEARYGQIAVANGSHLSNGALGRLLGKLKPDDVIQANTLENILLQLNQTPGVQAVSTLQAGQQAGTADMLISAAATPKVDGNITLDNYGGAYTGEYRINGAMRINSPLAQGDQLQLYLMSSNQRQLYHQIDYSLPINSSFTRVGGQYADMRYRLGKDFSVLEGHGTARTKSLYLSQPIWRDRQSSLDTRLQYEDRQLNDDIDLFSARSRKRSRIWSGGIDFQRQDNFGGGGINAWSLGYQYGTTHIGPDSARINDSKTAQTHGMFNIMTFSAIRLQRLTEKFSLYTQFSGQLASSNLDSASKFGLGGVSGVRAYPGSEASGDEGWISSAELRYAVTPEWQLSLFTDYGRSRTNKFPWSEEKNRQQRAASGIGTQWRAGDFYLSTQMAWRIGTTGNSSLKNDPQPQWWLQVGQSF